MTDEETQDQLYASAGDAYARSADSARALQHFREALSVLSQVQSEDPANVDVRLRVAGISNKVASMLTRSNDLVAATTMYRKALELVRPEAAARHPNEQALYSTADSYAGLGETEVILAKDDRQTQQNQIKHWDQARSWYQQSMDTWRQVKEPGMISPGGLDCIPPATVARHLALCRAALTRLTARSSARRQ